MKKTTINYQDGHTNLIGSCVEPANQAGKIPAVLVAHDWSGKNDFACQKAERLAELGYIGFALDMFGEGKTGKSNEEKAALIQPFLQDRKKLQQRMTAAFSTVSKLARVDPANIGAIGFCFGGLCVLDLARSGALVKGVVSFHGLLNAPEFAAQRMHAKILALHGYDDPMVTPEHVISFADEMTKTTVDWQLHMYGHTMHAFTNPQANDPKFGTVYEQKANDRSWLAMKNFFQEIFNA